MNVFINRLKFRIVILGALFFLLATDIKATGEDSLNSQIFLIIASYNPDTKRVSDFISEFEKGLNKSGFKGRVLLEDLGCKDFSSESHLWKNQVAILLKKYHTQDLKSIIILGQEAWASFLQQDSLPDDIPFFTVFASENGILLPGDSLMNKGNEVSVDMLKKADSLGYGGGFVNVYDFNRNIKLIRSFYPNVQNIAFVSDNTYGGVSLQAAFKKEMQNYKDLDYTLIDSRNYTTEEAQKVIANLPENSVILMGTWRVDKDGLYYLGSSLPKLIEKNLKIPVFSVSSSGIGTIAIGGYVPQYYTSAMAIVDQIKSFYNGQRDSVHFVKNGGEYQFDKSKLNDLGVHEYQLPSNSEIITSTDERLKRYQNFLYLISSILIALILFAGVLYYLYSKIRRLKNNLERNEIELIDAKNRAEESDRLKTAFLANMSHEIRTPLNAIVGFSNILTEDNLTKEDRETYNDVITKNSEMLLSLINDILDISRLETGKASFNYKEENVNDICYNIVSTTLHIRKESIEYIFIPTQDDLVIQTDVNKLSQVLLNLLTNANKFTDNGTITLTYDYQKQKQIVLFSVTDTGCGIPNDCMEKVFERFEKYNETKQGTGLGLAICRQIVSKFGGKIWVDQSYTTGARVFFTHPVKIV